MFCTKIYILTVSEHFLHGVVSRVNDDDEDESHAGGDEGGGQEVGDGPEGDHAGHLGVEAGGSSDQAGDHKGKNHQLEKSHELKFLEKDQLEEVLHQNKNLQNKDISTSKVFRTK